MVTVNNSTIRKPNSSILIGNIFWFKYNIGYQWHKQKINKNTLLRVITLDNNNNKKKTNKLLSRVITLNTSNMHEVTQHFLSRVMTLDKENILSSTIVKAVKTSFSTVFPSTPSDSHLDCRNNFF
jgi:hypothetical protein